MRKIKLDTKTPIQKPTPLPLPDTNLLQVLGDIFYSKHQPVMSITVDNEILPSANQIINALKHSKGFGNSLERVWREAAKFHYLHWLEREQLGGEFVDTALYESTKDYTFSQYYWGNLWSIGSKSSDPRHNDSHGNPIKGRGYDFKCEEHEDRANQNKLYEHRWPPHLPLVTKHGVILIKLYYPNRIARDIPNTYFKALIDGLADAGIIHDDCIISGVYPVCLGVADKASYTVELYDLDQLISHPYILPGSKTSIVTPRKVSDKPRPSRRRKQAKTKTVKSTKKQL